MGRIKKVASERHTATASPFVTNFVQEATSTPLAELPSKLDSFPQNWPFPRGDLYHWIALLDRFDHLLELFNKEYGLDKGPQQQAFGCRLLERGDAEDAMPYPATKTGLKELRSSGYSDEGDRELVECVLHFTRLLLERCGNRSLYSSSTHLSDLLHTSSLTLLHHTLKLSLRLAQRYHAARGKASHAQAQAALLANHYNINLDRLQKIAQPFPKPPQPVAGTSGTPQSKGKERASNSFNPSDLVKVAKNTASASAKSEMANVNLTYYEQSSTTSRPSSSNPPNDGMPVTPTPVRRTSTLGPSRDRQPAAEDRSAAAGNEPSATPIKSRETDDSAPASSSPKTYQIPAAKVVDTPAWDLIRVAIDQVPKDSAYDLLHRLRIAKAFSDSNDAVQQLLEIRLLAIANLSFAIRDSGFHEKIVVPDSEEPKQFHLAQQLCDLLQPPAEGQAMLSLDLEIAVLTTLDALSKVRHKAAEVSDALQVTHNHGVIYFELRKVIATLHLEEHADKKVEQHETEWREATFDLTNALLQSNLSARQGERMVNAGLMGILVEALNLRTSRAERFLEKVLQFFDTFIHGIPTAFQTLDTIKGFDALADLAGYEVSSSLSKARDGTGLPADYKSRVMDYNIPFSQQSTLRQLLKFMVHMYEHNAGTHDRLLRNLIDTPQILGALRTVIENAAVFGSNVWSGAVNILSSFIHNEPTSFQVVNEAGLVQSLLQTIVPWDLKEVGEDTGKLEDMPIQLEYREDGELIFPTPTGILPANDTMCDIPTAFGAICLNESGMKQFQSSKALFKFMDIFVSPPHVRALDDDGHVASAIGQAFDELSRHQPQLKGQIIWTVIAMVKRVGEVCKYFAERKSVGAKLWENGDAGLAVSGGKNSIAGASADDGDASTPLTVAQVGEDAADHADGVPYITACFKFLDGFFHNAGMCSQFCEQGGAIYLLDLATSASNPYDLVAFPVFRIIAGVIKTMCDAKPHLVLPSLIRRTQDAISGLQPIIDNSDSAGVFAPFTDLSNTKPAHLSGVNGTAVVKSLAKTHILTHLLGRAFSPPSFTSRNNPMNMLFSSLNFTDVYIELVDYLTSLHAALVWETLAIQKSIPEEWKQPTDPKPFVVRRVDADGCVELTGENKSHDNQANGEDSANTSAAKFWDSDKPNAGLAVKNVKTVRYLLSQAPMGIESFLLTLGQAMGTKRTTDAFVKQDASAVAEQLASKMVWEIGYKKFETVDEDVEVRYLFQVMSSTARLLVKHSSSMESHYPHKEALLLVLNKFYLHDGFDKINECLRRFAALATSDTEQIKQYALEGANSILSFYNQVVRDKCINGSGQANNIIAVKDHRQPDFFVPGQTLVEIRAAVLPAVRELWDSASLTDLGQVPAKNVVEILRVILGSEGEDRALKRSDKAVRRVLVAPSKPNFRARLLHRLNGLPTLVSAGFATELATEALYRCNGNESHSREYCNLRANFHAAPAFPVPEEAKPPEEENKKAEEDGSKATDESAEAAALQRTQSVDMTDAGVSAEAAAAAAAPEQAATADADAAPGQVHPAAAEGARIARVLADDDSADLYDLIDQDRISAAIGLDVTQRMTAAETAALSNAANASSSSSSSAYSPGPTRESSKPFVVLEDLDEARTELREDLMDRCLEVLSRQPNITFELADLIQAAVARDGDAPNPRAEIGGTLVSSLLSLQGETPSKDSGTKISAYAHLVALILQDRDFFDSTLDELKDYFDALISWVQLEPDQKAEDAPWIEMILLIIERVLAVDEQPALVEWNAQAAEDGSKPLPPLVYPELVISAELRTSLFDALVNLLPKIGKDASLALSVLRVLVTLTRRRELALRLSDKQSMQRLFMMFRQLGGNFNDKLQCMFMLILRHMVEDKAIIRQIMETETTRFVASHTQRYGQVDMTLYTRNLYHLILRDPELFAEVSDGLVEIPRFESASRANQHLALKKPKEAGDDADESANGDSSKQPTEGTTAAAAVAAESSSDASKPAETKPPTVETTDGVIQFLLRELSNYRDVEDQPPSEEKRPTSQNGASADVEMTDDGTPANGNAAENAAGAERAKSDKSAFKPEEHIIYKYRCFLLQCLSELLTSYNRTKIEFINFSRKPEAQLASTPSKPRAGMLNYMLNSLLPAGTLENSNDVDLVKKISTSSHANSVLVSLCAKTQEVAETTSRTSADTASEDTDLTFVRKFVLEHALRALKDASSSSELLDQRYSRLLALSDLFNSMLHVEYASSQQSLPSGQHMGRLMYEKNFVTALTSAIAEIDLNFPNAKRAVKGLLAPLRYLTSLGVELSQSPDFSSATTGTTDEEGEEISSATSVSDEDDDEEDREQTPDLYRNSTLGMLEASANREEDDSESDSEGEEDEDEMFVDEYDEEMDFEEEELAEHGEVISDEDEDDYENMEGEMGEIEGIPGDPRVIEVNMHEGEDDSAEDDDDDMDEDEDDDEEDDDDDEDQDEFDVDQMMDEITGDAEGGSLDDPVHEEEGWEDDEGAGYDDQEGDEEDLQRRDRYGFFRNAPFPGAIAPVDPAVDGGGVVRVDDEEYFEDEMPPDDDEDDDGDEGEAMYEPGTEGGLIRSLADLLFSSQPLDTPAEDDDDEDGYDIQFEWDAPPPPRMGGHHHTHRPGLPETLEMIGAELQRSAIGRSLYRPPHPAQAGRSGDDGTNPLLQRTGGGDGGAHDADAEANSRLSRLARRPIFPRGFQEIIHGMGHGGGGIAISMHPQGLGNDLGPPIWSLSRNPQELPDLSRGYHRHRDYGPWSGAGFLYGDARNHSHGFNDGSASQGRQASTVQRWQEEARTVFGGKHSEKASRIVNALLRVLVPPAIEAKKKHDKEEAERKAALEKAREEKRKKDEEERLEREAREKQEQEEREAREAEERRVREEAQRAEAATGSEGEAQPDEQQQGDQAAQTNEMEGVQPSQTAESGASTTAPEEPSQRVTAIVRGREMDITHLGIDPEYLAALPEEFREDVIMAQVAQQRAQPPQPLQQRGGEQPSGEQPTEISQDFLDALPEDLRLELLQQEERERRQAQRRQAVDANAQPAGPQEISNADLFAMLDGQLRQDMLRDLPEDQLAQLPEDMQREAQNLIGHRHSRNGGLYGRVLADEMRAERGHRAAQPAHQEDPRPRRPVMQMLDKAGVATLMRLMFVSLHHKAKSYLHSIFSNVCKNTQGRAEVISILLSILQDGTVDVNAVERSFAHLSLRAKQLAGPKTPQPLKRTATGTVVTPGAELSPLNIVQQCLGTLNALASVNPRVPSFFLSEHEMVVSQKNKPSKKGKGRETKANKFPLNALLTLLDRALITENIGVMESLATLLSRVTHPLNILLKRRKTAHEPDKALESSGSGPDANAAEPTTTEGGATETAAAGAAATEATATEATSSDVSMAEAGNAESAQQTTSTAETADTVEATNTEDKEADDEEAAGKENKKKHRELVPPDVPEENLRLVVNIISARECPGRTFSDTLDVIRNLSAIPGAKPVFGKELVRQAQELAQTVSDELEELTPQINEASTGTELQGVALAKFASTGARQNKLLRVLVALDYLFDPKRVPETEESSEPSGEPQLKVDILASLYESSIFDKLWSNLSLSLAAIRERGNMVNVAATLLPVIESLMVVCKNASLQDVPADVASPIGLPATPKAGANMEALFFNFTEENRKILNELVRNNPKLMNGNLSIMAKNSKVLEFDNKRSYFARKLHHRGSETRAPHVPPLQLHVRRDNVFVDSYKSLFFKQGDEIKYGKFNIRFANEEGIDAGGVSREWFAAMARQMFNPDNALFNPVASDRTTFHPNPFSGINEHHLSYFKFIGRIIGKALYEGRVLDCHFSRAVYRRILGKTVSLKDMESLDLDYYRSLVWILENDITDITFETFSVDVDRFGVTETHDLIENGRNIPVTQENKQEYVQKVVEHRLIKSVEEQLDKFLNGFHDIIPKELIAIFNEQELELLISGLPEIDVDDWKNNTEYHNYQATSPQIQWFWRAVRSFDKEEKAKLLQFITGTSKVPLNGFKELEGMNGFAKFNIHRDYSSKEKLPSSHTCFNQLDLPEYESYEHLRHQLYTAITAGSEYFGFA